MIDRLRNRPHPPRFPVGLINSIMRGATRAHRRALDTLTLTAASFQYAVARALEVEEREAAARVLLGDEGDQNGRLQE